MTAASLPVVTKAPLVAHFFCLCMTLALFMAITTVGQRGWSVPTFVLALVSAHGLMGLAGVVLEKRPLTDIFSLRYGSWAFIIGDVALATLLWRASLQWRSPEVGRGFFGTPWWVMISLVVGIGAAVAFYFVLERGGYVEAEATDLLSSPTHLIHGEITYPVLAGSLFCLGVPALWHSNWSSWAPYLILGLFLVWIACGIRDGVAGLNPYLLHHRYDWANWRPL